MRRNGIEHRFRKELRSLQLNPRKEILLVRTETIEHEAAKELLHMVFGGRAKVTTVPSTTRKRHNIYTPTSLENELVEELRSFLEDTERQRKFLPLMATIPEQEILAYCHGRGIKGKTLAAKDDVRKLLEMLQTSQPQTKAALRKSFAWLKNQNDE